MEDLPDDATIEDAMECLYLMFRIERGLAQVEAGETVSNEEAKARMSQWLQ
jgi:predicted transcriptional regulator